MINTAGKPSTKPTPPPSRPVAVDLPHHQHTTPYNHDSARTHPSLTSSRTRTSFCTIPAFPSAYIPFAHFGLHHCSIRTPKAFLFRGGSSALILVHFTGVYWIGIRAFVSSFKIPLCWSFKLVGLLDRMQRDYYCRFGVRYIGHFLDALDSIGLPAF